MARNTQVAGDPNAPPITQILARFVATHPSRGWTDAVEHEGHRTFLNWVGCAVGAATHEAMRAALAGVQMLQPAPQATILGRRDRVDMAAPRCSTASARTPSISTTPTSRPSSIRPGRWPRPRWRWPSTWVRAAAR